MSRCTTKDCVNVMQPTARGDRAICLIVHWQGREHQRPVLARALRHEAISPIHHRPFGGSPAHRPITQGGVKRFDRCNDTTSRRAGPMYPSTPERPDDPVAACTVDAVHRRDRHHGGDEACHSHLIEVVPRPTSRRGLSRMSSRLRLPSRRRRRPDGFHPREAGPLPFQRVERQGPRAATATTDLRPARQRECGVRLS